MELKKIDSEVPEGSNHVVQETEPAGFWIRLVATCIDGLILMVLSGGGGHLARITGLSKKLGVNPITDPTKLVQNGKINPEMMMALLGALVLGLAISLIIGFFYFGWFYKNKGGSPGKLMVGLRVENFETKENIGYFSAFLRDYIGKFISGPMTLWIGYIMAGLRSDKKAIHDMLMGTQVVQEKEDD